MRFKKKEPQKPEIQEYERLETKHRWYGVQRIKSVGDRAKGPNILRDVCYKGLIINLGNKE